MFMFLCTTVKSIQKMSGCRPEFQRRPIHRIIAIVIFASLGFSHFALAVPKLNAQTSSRPNVIFILADDLGYGDLSCYGQKHFSTPHIDALAKSGLKFTKGYSGSTVCAPSRCCLMTGLHSGHAAVRGNQEIKPEGQAPMPADTKTVAHLMQSAGYQTGVFGKWGLGGPKSVSAPIKMGFDRFYGYNCQREAHCYYPGHLWSDTTKILLSENADGQERQYAPDLIQREALKFIRANREKPFFCYYAAIQPHADIVAPQKYMQRHRGKYGVETPHTTGHYRAQAEPRAAFAAMVNVLDDYVGEIVSALETQGIADNTLIIFTSDNGPHKEGGHDYQFFDCSGGLRGEKRDLYEGGVRVPMIAAWPSKIAAATETDQTTAFWDFLPTMAALTGQALSQETDGVSILPTLFGQPDQQQQHDYLYWEFPAKKGRVAIRKGDWKGVRYDVSKDPNSPLELYDLKSDVGEANNIARRNPEVVGQLDKLLQQARRVPENPNFSLLKKKKKANN